MSFSQFAHGLRVGRLNRSLRHYFTEFPRKMQQLRVSNGNGYGGTLSKESEMVKLCTNAVNTENKRLFFEWTCVFLVFDKYEYGVLTLQGDSVSVL